MDLPFVFVGATADSFFVERLFVCVLDSDDDELFLTFLLFLSLGDRDLERFPIFFSVFY